MLNKHDKTYFLKISEISNYTYSNIINFIGIGPSIKSRARFALSLIFILVIPVFITSVNKTEQVIKDSVALTKYDNFHKKVVDAKLLIKDLDLAMWNYVD